MFLASDRVCTGSSLVRCPISIALCVPEKMKQKNIARFDLWQTLARVAWVKRVDYGSLGLKKGCRVELFVNWTTGQLVSPVIW